MKLTPEMLSACYAAVRASVPRWKLPPASEVKFTVTRHKDRHADYTYDGEHAIRVSENQHNLALTVLRSVAHEACHLRVQIAKPSQRTEHGNEWKKAAATICKVWGWDVADF